ncbi:MAG: ABC transporter substrate-binding protein [Kutzneria sp.]|nr:ABC transporter substrate-binding protein [Kutzneria sp.]
MLATAAVVAPLLVACGSGPNAGITINVYLPPEEHFQQVIDNCGKQAAGRYSIVYNKLPRDADGQREQMVRRLAANDTGMDVLGLDVTFTAEFAGAGWIEEWTGDRRAEAEKDVLAAPLESAKYQGKLYAATKNTNVQLLWYRDDVVSTPPTTWSDMIAAAERLKAEGKPNQIAFTGAQYEGLVVEFATLVASAGGHILSDDGTKAVLDDGAIRALQTLKDFATAGVTSPSMTNDIEDDARHELENGQSAFEVNWPYVYAAMQADKPDLAKHFTWAPVPGVDPGQPSRVAIGGRNLAVSAFSPHKAEAFDAALCLRNAANQEYSAINDGVPPTISSVYDDPAMTGPYPMKDTIRQELRDAATRPITPAYQNVSTLISTILSPPSAIDPRATADELRTKIQQALDSKGVLP